MNHNGQQGTLLTETNWHEIVSNIQAFPFRVSEMSSLHKEISLSRVSFKYNIEGCETYYNGHKEATLHTGEYLIASNQQTCEVEIDTGHQIDLGLCVDINVDCLLQGMQAYLQPNQYISQADKLSYFLEDDFFIRYKSNKEFHRYVTQLATRIKTNDFDSLQELEFDFVHHFLFHQTSFLLAYKQVPAIKKSTRNDLFSKMTEARNMLQDSIYQEMSISMLARTLYLSEYRLFHLFKATFHVSPHKYLLQLKMNEAIRLYRTQQNTWTEIALKLRFADLQCFSKLFKKQFLMSPSEYSKKVSLSNNM